MDLLAIPRLIWELVLYLFDVMPDLLPIILALATPLALGALCGVLNERSGVVNIGIEGIMLMAAFFGYLTGFALHETLGTPVAVTLGIAVAVLTGAVLGLLHAWLTVSRARRSDHRRHDDEHRGVRCDRISQSPDHHAVRTRRRRHHRTLSPAR